ncbi:MAG: hypothetical protein U0T73_14355 [Chitinophagales bacterium]
MIGKIVSDLLVFLSSMVKFAFGASAVVGADLGLSGTLSSVLGGICGIVLFTYLGEFIREWLIKTFPQRFNKRFTKGNRLLVKIKQHFGITGIAFMTPILLSIPVGVFFALDLTSHKRKVIVPMIAACLFWSMVFFVPYYVFDINVVGWIKARF